MPALCVLLCRARCGCTAAARTARRPRRCSSGTSLTVCLLLAPHPTRRLSAATTRASCAPASHRAAASGAAAAPWRVRMPKHSHSCVCAMYPISEHWRGGSRAQSRLHAHAASSPLAQMNRCPPPASPTICNRSATSQLHSWLHCKLNSWNPVYVWAGRQAAWWLR